MAIEFNNTEEIVQISGKFHQKKLKKHGKRNLLYRFCKKDTIAIIVTIVFLISVYSSVFIFYPSLYKFQASCNYGFYDSIQDPDILKCTGNIQITYYK